MTQLGAGAASVSASSKDNPTPPSSTVETPILPPTPKTVRWSPISLPETIRPVRVTNPRVSFRKPSEISCLSKEIEAQGNDAEESTSEESLS
jgi:hypothetical protein